MVNHCHPSLHTAYNTTPLPIPPSLTPVPIRKRYGHSKLASIIHARALHDRLRDPGITAYALHPGIIKTNLQTADPSLFGFFVRGAIGLGIMPGLVSVPDGARTTLYCATAEGAVEGSGGYFLPFGEVDAKRTGKW